MRACVFCRRRNVSLQVQQVSAIAEVSFTPISQPSRSIVEISLPLMQAINLSSAAIFESDLPHARSDLIKPSRRQSIDLLWCGVQCSGTVLLISDWRESGRFWA